MGCCHQALTACLWQTWSAATFTSAQHPAQGQQQQQQQGPLQRELAPSKRHPSVVVGVWGTAWALLAAPTPMGGLFSSNSRRPRVGSAHVCGRRPQRQQQQAAGTAGSLLGGHQRQPLLQTTGLALLLLLGARQQPASALLCLYESLDLSIGVLVVVCHGCSVCHVVAVAKYNAPKTTRTLTTQIPQQIEVDLKSHT